jgi:hypothetical protein
MALSNFYWDQTKPPAGLLIADIPQAFNYLIANVEALLGNEHETFPDASNTGSYHLQGSARPFFQDAAPTTKTNGEAFTSTDNGALWVDSNSTPDNSLYVLTDYSVPTWTSIADIIAASTAIDLAGTLDVTGAVTFDSTLQVDGAVTLGTTLTVDSVDITNIDTSAEGLTDDDVSIPTSALVQDGLDTKESLLVTQGTASIFGARTRKDTSAADLTVNQVYQAECDGFIMASIKYDSAANYETIILLEGATSNPATQVCDMANGVGQACFCYPASKDMYYKITSTGNDFEYIQWKPIGTGGLEQVV